MAVDHSLGIVLVCARMAGGINDARDGSAGRRHGN